MTSNFVVGAPYARKDIAAIIDLPLSRRKGGNWETGYAEWCG